MDLQVINQDGRLAMEFDYSAMTVVERESKGVKTGVVARKLNLSLTNGQLEQGLGFDYSPDGSGEQRRLKKATLVLEDVDPRSVTEKADAKRLRGLVSDVRKAVGLTKTKAPLSDRDLMTSAEFGDWILGSREFKGFKWEALPALTKDKLIEVRKELAKRGAGAVKPNSPTETARQALEILGSMTITDPALLAKRMELEKGLAELEARQAKARSAKAAPKASEAEIELSEQSDI